VYIIQLKLYIYLHLQLIKSSKSSIHSICIVQKLIEPIHLATAVCVQLCMWQVG